VMDRATDGMELWQYARQESMSVGYTFLACIPRIILLVQDKKGSVFVALDPEDGREVWKIPVPARSHSESTSRIIFW
jgi:outer membrane protein assembly factor BamB